MTPKINSVMRRSGLTATVLTMLIFFAWDEARLENFFGSFGLNNHRAIMGVSAGFIVLFTIAAIVWSLRPLWTDKKRHNDTPSRLSGMVIIGVLTFAMITLPCEAQSQSIAVPIDEVRVLTSTIAQPDELVSDSHKLSFIDYLLDEGFLLGDNSLFLYQPLPPWSNLTLLECGLALTIVVIFIGGVAVVFYKMIRACNNIDKKRKKQMEADPEQGETNSFSASFFISRVSSTQADEDLGTCDCAPPVSFNFETTSTGTSPIISTYIPTNTIELIDYLRSQGLSTNILTNSFSANRSSVGSLAQVSFNDGVITVNVGPSDKTNILTQIEYSTNLLDWVKLPALSVPPGTKVRVSDSWHDTSNPQGFWRVRNGE